MSSRHRLWLLLLSALGIAACGDHGLGPNISGVSQLGIWMVRIVPDADTVVIGDSVSNGSVQLMAQAIDRANKVITDMAFVWTTSDDAVAVVDSLGVVKGIAPGTAVISASAGKIGRATVTVMGSSPSLSVSASRH